MYQCYVQKERTGDSESIVMTDSPPNISQARSLNLRVYYSGVCLPGRNVVYSVLSPVYW